MKNKSAMFGVLHVLKRLPSSTNGNPRYMLRIDNVVFVTAPDSGLAYRIPNFDGKNVKAELGMHYGKLTVDSIEESAP